MIATPRKATKLAISVERRGTSPSQMQAMPAATNGPVEAIAALRQRQKGGDEAAAEQATPEQDSPGVQIEYPRKEPGRTPGDRRCGDERCSQALLWIVLRHAARGSLERMSLADRLIDPADWRRANAFDTSGKSPAY